MASSLTGIPVLLRRVDRIAAGRRQRDLRAPAGLVEDPAARRALRTICWILGAEIVIGATALVITLMDLLGGVHDHPAVWLRGLVVLGLTVSLGYFVHRAGEGWYWAYLRIRLFAWIFPLVTLATAALPGLYPAWMVVEQVVFAALMIGIAVLTSSAPLRTAFAAATLRTADPYEP